MATEVELLHACAHEESWQVVVLRGCLHLPDLLHGCADLRHSSLVPLLLVNCILVHFRKVQESIELPLRRSLALRLHVDINEELAELGGNVVRSSVHRVIGVTLMLGLAQDVSGFAKKVFESNERVK